MADDCPCQPCKDRRWVIEWAEEKDVPRPPDDLVKFVIRTHARHQEVRGWSDIARRKALDKIGGDSRLAESSKPPHGGDV